jgi:beta-lactamase regulating signal transducer with metallopeptidase domain
VDALLRVGASNALAACALALLAAAVARLCRRPAVAHSLWLIVLLKLVTPPVLPVRLPGFPASPAAPRAVALPADTDQAAPPATEGEAGPVTADAVLAPDEQELPAPTVVVPARPLTADLIPAPAPPATARTPFPWAGAALLLWAAGSSACFAVAAIRAYRFARLLRFAEAAPTDLQERAEALAARLGLARCPGIWLVPGQLSPMLWAIGGTPRVFLPAGLLGRLGLAQQDALLAHELAHLRRRDHWVRGLEMLVNVLYWWHPVVWWARRELREAEEQCCDAWVLWALPGAQKTYALALVETVDFLSEAWSVLPQGASGIGQVQHLRRRITMIMRGTTPRALTWVGGLAVAALGAMLLPLLPTWDQTQAADPVQAARGLDLLAAEGQSVQTEAAKAEAEKARVQMEMYRVQLAQAQKDFEAAMFKVRAAEAAAKDAEKKTATAPQAKQRKVILIITAEDGREQRVEVPGAKLMIEGIDSRPQYYTARVTTAAPLTTYTVATHALQGGRDLEKRVADLEKELKQVRQELDTLKRPGQQHGAAPQQPANPAYGNFFERVAPAASTSPATPAAQPSPTSPPPAGPGPATGTSTTPPATPAKP